MIWGFPIWVISTGCRAATTDHAKHALSMDCTLITAFFILISRGNVTTRMQQICLHWESNSGIRPHFWNSFSDARLDNARCVSFLQIRRIEEFIISYVILFARLSLVMNSPLNIVFDFIELCLCIMFRTRFPAQFHSRLLEIGEVRYLEFMMAPVSIRLSNAESISRLRVPHCTRHCTHLHDHALNL